MALYEYKSSMEDCNGNYQPPSTLPFSKPVAHGLLSGACNQLCVHGMDGVKRRYADFYCWGCHRPSHSQCLIRHYFNCHFFMSIEDKSTDAFRALLQEKFLLLHASVPLELPKNCNFADLFNDIEWPRKEDYVFPDVVEIMRIKKALRDSRKKITRDVDTGTEEESSGGKEGGKRSLVKTEPSRKSKMSKSSSSSSSSK